MEKVSIILPVYNVEKYISDCLDSLVEQTYTNVEIIVVDDGSKDSSGSIADSYAKNDERIMVIHKENGGVATARNAGLLKATGEYVVFVDPDDWVVEDHIEYLLKLQSMDDADMCMTTALYTQKGEKQPDNIVEKTISNADAATMLLSPDMYVGSYSKIYKRKWLIDNNLLQNETIFSGEGLHFTVKAAQYANCVTISNKKIYFYRRNVSSSATTKFNIKMFSNNEHSLNVIKEEKIIQSDNFDIMWKLFRAHLFASGILAIINNSAKQIYGEEYTYWMSTIKKDIPEITHSKIIPFKSKVRLTMVVLCPKMWALLASLKRKKVYKKSV